MRRETTLSIWCGRLMEAGWLLCIALIPLYFNLFSARHFEPDKATSLRAIVLLLAALGLIRALERANLSESRPLTEPTGNPLATWWRGLMQVPLALPVLAYSAVFLLTTITSVVPLTSFWGSYQRLQGTYTNLSYIGLFVILVATMRQREQFERLITVAISTCVAVASYGVLQHQGLDPLPWGGDVIRRVASTMGNSIFVASYMLMIVPLALYRLFTALYESRRAPVSTNGRSDWLWALAHVLLLVSTLALLLSVFKLGAIVRTADTRYWWAIPGAIGVAAALWALPTLAHRGGAVGSRLALPLWPAALYASYMLLLLLVFAVSAISGAQQIDTRIVNGQDWWVWLLVSLAALVGFYMLGLTLPPPPAVASQLSQRLRVAGYALVTLLFLVAIFFTQSRGPWIGLGFGLFTFFFVLLWQMTRRARQQENLALAGRLRAALGAWVALTLTVGGFLIVFNLSDAPVFQQLREVPYVGRMGRLLEVDEGTGLVRRLIWAGDQHAGGAVALISSDPLRAVIGWGPESMFVAFNRFYPPSLANVEARGASPDRSHQALLDELVTRGVLGLLSYFFLLFSAVALCWRNMQRSDNIRWQFFFIAALSVLVGTFVDGLTGIPIVSTLMMFWTTLALVVVGGMLAGVYSFGAAPAALPVVEALAATARPAGQRNAGKRASARGATATVSRSGGRSQLNPGAMGLYVVLLVLALGGVWWFNLTPV
ncbi:MAG: O-antigen ligase family protein, partial [Chloroflexaceae bacterium]|nr:O-antigen ligase family protein [Chloroflexaceae bacterium]